MDLMLMVLKTRNSNVPAIAFCVITGIFSAMFSVSATLSCISCPCWRDDRLLCDMSRKLP